jgi:hypothetical protein
MRSDRLMSAEEVMRQPIRVVMLMRQYYPRTGGYQEKIMVFAVDNSFRDLRGEIAFQTLHPLTLLETRSHLVEILS